MSEEIEARSLQKPSHSRLKAAARRRRRPLNDVHCCSEAESWVAGAMARWRRHRDEPLSASSRVGYVLVRASL